MSQEAVPVEKRVSDHILAVTALERAAEEWLEQRAAKGARMPRRYDLALDLAMADYRRTQRRLDETRKRALR